MQINANANAHDKPKHAIAVGVSPISYRGKPNIKGWSGYKQAVQRWGSANASAYRGAAPGSSLEFNANGRYAGWVHDVAVGSLVVVVRAGCSRLC